jgi:hypothetical protein
MHFEQKNIFLLLCGNALVYYNASVVLVMCVGFDPAGVNPKTITLVPCH